jgi:hypothetical protein
MCFWLIVTFNHVMGHVVGEAYLTTKPSASSDRLSEIEFDVRPSQLCMTFHDILSKGGPLFYSNND